MDNEGIVGNHTSLALTSQNFAVVSYWDASNSNLKLAVCLNANCADKSTITVDSDGAVGYNASLALNRDDFPVISYLNSSGGNLKLAVCSNTDCTSKTITTLGGSGGYAGWFNSLALNHHGSPVISYYDLTHGSLKLAVCINAACTSHALAMAEPAGNHRMAGKGEMPMS